MHHEKVCCHFSVDVLPLIFVGAKNDKDYLNVQVFMEDGLEHGCSLTRGDQLLIALLIGGDYDAGVPGCGIEIMHKVALHSKIGQMLLDAFLSMTPDEFSEWAKELIEDLHTLLSTNSYNSLERRYKAVAEHIPQGFPQHAVVSKYVHTFTSFLAGAAALPWDISFYQPDLVNLADFCRQHLSWEDDAIVEKMYGGIWEGAYLHALCKLPKCSADQADLRQTFKIISPSTLMALRHDIEVYSIKVDCRCLGRNTLGNATPGQLSALYMHVPKVILSHIAPEVV
ncbi:uncharacterized protein F5147DRAFT_778961 [Suillus discolor]|uniref:Uncharacterized protein n=1 Tax=Suillus discolor TaxID=1912936 RepID=A0A9P7EY59_9AGAM|nr:uncharacterized protein F5147DRAFT_778961 [Suillus discolor]KAG2094652.1 hypothetical protein F5147DRAFT_778961 [Suillus discolor]